jgi:multiple sugar transport system ATP-binding protein
MPSPLLQLTGISKTFGRVRALQDVNLDVFADELLVVLGPTGAGKTTLLRIIAGLEGADTGMVSLQGQDVTGWPPAMRDVAFVFQNFSLYPDRTVRANMEFPLRAPGRNMTGAQIAERVEWAAGLLKITHLLDRPSTRLSGGEMQRVAIGRAIVRRPRLFLMDEPLTNLDAKLREALRVELVMLRRELKTAMIFVTHDQTEAMSMSDRIVVLLEGRILQSGAPEDVYRKPVSPTVARQLGQPAINIMEAANRDGHWLAADGTVIAKAALHAPSRAMLGIRPEDVQLTGGDSTGKVRVVENLGPMKIVLFDWAGQSVHAIARATDAISAGDIVAPRVDSSRIVVWST